MGNRSVYNKGDNVDNIYNVIDNDDDRSKCYSYAHSLEHLFPLVFVNMPPYYGYFTVNLYQHPHIVLYLVQYSPYKLNYRVDLYFKAVK